MEADTDPSSSYNGLAYGFMSFNALLASREIVLLDKKFRSMCPNSDEIRLAKNFFSALLRFCLSANEMPKGNFSALCAVLVMKKLFASLRFFFISATSPCETFGSI